MDKQTIIEKHLKGILNAAEQAQFDSWVKEDAKFRNEVKFLTDLSAAVTKEEQSELKSRLVEVEKKIGSKGKRLGKRIALIVLGVLLLLAAYFGYRMEEQKNTPAGIYAANYKVYPNVYFPVTRGKTDVMSEAFMAYERGDYKVAAEKIEERLQTSSALELKFYQAMSYAEMGNLPLAIRKLEDVRRFDSAYVDECYWYLALFYMKQGNYPAAIERFQTFYEISTDEPKKEVAKKSIYLLQAQ
jgi:tetratricopeptide (TPR) repeat protein